MPESDLSLLIDAARAAGEVALHYWRQEPRIWDKPGDEGPVTEADFAVDNLLRETLLAARPDYGWLSEETEDDAARLTAERVFIVDPIDGTRAFIKGETSFAHALAVAERGKIIAGVIFLPAKKKLYSAARGQGAHLNDALVAPIVTPDPVPNLLATRVNFDPANWPGGVPEVRRHFRPSLAYRMALAADGSFDGMLTLRDSWEWDIAAGALIAAEAGLEVSDRHGAALRFNNPHPKTPGVLALPQELHRDYVKALTP